VRLHPEETDSTIFDVSCVMPVFTLRQADGCCSSTDGTKVTPRVSCFVTLVSWSFQPHAIWSNAIVSAQVVGQVPLTPRHELRRTLRT
jgi:hypothetical protein